jgi:dTDP-4-dehydrorhamnose reductase
VLRVKVLVLGSQGQVGQALLASAADNLQVTGASRAEVDVTNREQTLERIGRLKPDAIVNAAAYTAVDKAESEPQLAYATNDEGARNVAEAAAATGARLIHISTDFVFDGTASTRYRPDDPVNPLSVYGSSKAAGEAAVRSVLASKALILRTAWVYAAEGRNFLLTMLRLMKQAGRVRVVADQIGTPTSANSVARAIWKLLETRGSAGTYHWTDCGVASWYDFAVAIAEEAHAFGLVSERVEVIPIATEDYPTAARRPRFSVLDCTASVAAGFPSAHWRVNLRAVLGELQLA